MLQQRLGSWTVDMTEVEQPASHLGGDDAVGDPAQRRRLGVDKPQRPSVRGDRKAGRLREPGAQQFTVDKPLLGGACAKGEASGDRVVAP